MTIIACKAILMNDTRFGDLFFCFKYLAYSNYKKNDKNYRKQFLDNKKGKSFCYLCILYRLQAILHHTEKLFFHQTYCVHQGRDILSSRLCSKPKTIKGNKKICQTAKTILEFNLSSMLHLNLIFGVMLPHHRDLQLH